MSDRLSQDLASLRIEAPPPPATGRRIAWVLGGVALLALAAGAYTLALPLVEARLFKAEVTFTEVMLISPAQGTTDLTAAGFVVPQSISRVVAKVPGRIARVLVREGDRVAAGQVLLQLEDADQRAAIATAQSRVLAATARAHSARANLGEVKAQLVRNEGLVAAGAQGKATVEDLKARFDALGETAKAAAVEIKVAKAELAVARLGYGNLTVRSPMAGTVTVKPPQPGEPAGPDRPGVEIADFASLEVEADVPEGRLHLVKAGGPAEVVFDAFPGKRHRGQVSSVGSRVNRQKASVTVRVKLLDAAEGVLPDMAARVSFLQKALDAAAMKEPAKVVVPEAALTERGGAKVVFVADASGAVRMTPVALGARAQGGFELKQGPSPGTRLVKSPPDTLTDGQSVREKRD